MGYLEPLIMGLPVRMRKCKNTGRWDEIRGICCVYIKYISNTWDSTVVNNGNEWSPAFASSYRLTNIGVESCSPGTVS